MNLVTEFTTQKIKMFNVNLLSEVDVNLAEAYNLIVQVNEKLSKCANVSRKEVLSERVQMILTEIQWTVSMSKDGEKSFENEEDDITSSADESMEWDDYEAKNFYQTVFMDEEIKLDDDHGQSSESTMVSSEISDDDDSVFLPSSHSLPPIQSPLDPKIFDIKVTKSSGQVILTPVLKPKWIAPKTGPVRPVSSSDEDADDEDDDDNDEGQFNTVPDVAKDECGNFVSKMSATLEKLAPMSTYHVTRPKLFKVDLAQVNSRFLGNIPRPKEYPVLGCMEEAEAQVNTTRTWIPNWKWGFMTDCGIVPVPAEPVYGHVWSDSARDWVLHATPDDGTGPPPPPRQRGGRFRG